MGLDKSLLALAKTKLNSKVAYIPPDPSGGGGGAGGGMPPGMDPAAMGGAGGGAPPGMDPAAAGGAPPGGDPSQAAAGGAPPPSPSPSAGAGDLGTAVQQAVQQAMSSQQQMGAGGKPPKPDINMVATDVFQLKKMLFNVFRHLNLPLPDNILDGPGRDPTTGMPSTSPTGGSDPAAGQAQAPQPTAAQQSFPPIQPMDGMTPSPSGKSASHDANWNKIGSVFGDSTKVTTNAMTAARLLRSRRNKNES